MGGGILNKNAFTLIELLAIIVILAIIAVITVPIILNIIENSRKGAATDSAYGYKDAVNKWYVQELAKPNNQNLKLDKTYTVESDGKLTGKFEGDESQTKSVTIDISGTVPTSGSLTYENNVLKSGTLIIGDYTATYSNGSFTAVKTSAASNEPAVDPYSMAAMCPGCQFSDDYSYDGTLSDVSLNDNYDNLGSTFFGYVVSNNSIVQNYVCGNIGGNAFCLRGEVVESDFHNPFYGNNSDILTHFFGNICSTHQYGFSCENSADGLFIYNYLSDSTNNGLTSIQTDDDCSVYISCSETDGCGTSNNCS